MTLRPRHIHLCLAALAVALATGAVGEATSTPRPAQALGSPVVPAVDTYDRNAVNALYQSFYTAPPPDDWTGGSMAGCQPGTVSTDYQLAVVRRINYFRSLAGVRSDTLLATNRVPVAQAAALMMSAAGALSHAPATTWACYTADGATGAGSSNLALGVSGTDAVDLYMLDPGASNAGVGHRWWLLQPAATTFASGNVPSNPGHPAASAVYVFDVNTFATWPAVRDPAGLVLWPPRGYVPRPNVPERWSAFDDSTDFTSASVTATTGGVPVPVVVDNRGAGVAVWHFVDGAPAGDVAVRIQIAGATAGDAPVSIDYTTSVFEPTAGGGPGSTPPVDYHPVVPERLLDTRPGGPQVGYAGAKPVAGQSVPLQVTGVGTSSVPADAEAVALNVTATEPAGASYVTVWPCGTAQPRASNVNVTANQTLPNSVIVRIGAGGKVCLFTQSSAHLVVDITGWFPAGTTYRPSLPERLLDTRPGGPQAGFTGAKPAAGRVVELQLTGVGAAAVPWNAAAAVLNVTATEPDAPTYVTVWPCGEPRPTASNLNASAGQTVANLVIARVGAGGKVCLFTQSSAHLVADLNGWFPSGTGYMPVSPLRLLDTRPTTAVGGTPVRLVGGQTRQLPVTGAGIQPAGRAVVLNVTAVDPAGAGFVTVWPCGSPRPTASNLNLAAGVVTANLAVVAVDVTGAVCFYSSATVDLVVDRNGDF